MNERERGWYEYRCSVCGMLTTSSTVFAGSEYDGGTHCRVPMRQVRWVPVVADPSPPLRPREG